MKRGWGFVPITVLHTLFFYWAGPTLRKWHVSKQHGKDMVFSWIFFSQAGMFRDQSVAFGHGVPLTEKKKGQVWKQVRGSGKQLSIIYNIGHTK